jgi:hypothetical protein
MSTPFLFLIKYKDSNIKEKCTLQPALVGDMNNTSFAFDLEQKKQFRGM